MQIGIKALLTVLIIVLGYFLFNTIAEPIKLEKEKKFRYQHVKTRLMKIRDAQIAYKEVHGEFADSFEKLIATIKTQNLMVIRTIGNPDDTTVVVRRDTTFVPIVDSLFHGNMQQIDSLPLVPFAEGEKFTIQAGEITKGAVRIKVFEVADGAPFDPEDVYQVGSMGEASLSGNWER